MYHVSGFHCLTYSIFFRPKKEWVKFYGSNLRNETSSSVESSGSIDPCYLPSLEEIDITETEENFQDESDGNFEDPSYTASISQNLRKRDNNF